MTVTNGILFAQLENFIYFDIFGSFQQFLADNLEICFLIIADGPPRIKNV